MWQERNVCWGTAPHAPYGAWLYTSSPTVADQWSVTMLRVKIAVKCGWRLTSSTVVKVYIINLKDFHPLLQSLL